MARSILTTRRQSGDDWGMGDDDDMFGTDIMNMDPHSPEFAAAMAAQMGSDYQNIPGETDSSGFSSDFTDSGIQTTYDPEDTEEEETEEAGYIPGKETLKYTKNKKEQSGGVGRGGGRQQQFGRKQMVETTQKSSILAPNPNK